ncbi:site-specific DNA-methyltransferase [Streptomyces sp. DSM 44917]|uniref:Methyltransferase n=1 Tax=Streptomyces boetiae TaxID=3075541 RepID=A0ABU2L7D2_9ACTN|nr:site-specific DNA-methyltransferase [Streptomyces sp. DSM 44917]MDT0307213.1 site-specific DNA-methyltransferase [Streptomyces sp. DSM 44917]
MITPYFDSQGITLYTGDALDVLAQLPDGHADCVVTSPPYWGLRDYGTGTWNGGDPACTHSVGRSTNRPQAPRSAVPHPASPAHRGGSPRTCRRCGAVRHDRQYGLEPTLGEYIDTLRRVFAQLHRVLADTGTVWLNLGDSYAATPPGRAVNPMRTSTLTSPAASSHLRESVQRAGVDRTGELPPKNLLGVPWRVAFALQADGWILRNAVVWHKPNAMPESVTDRLSCRYELLFLLVKQRRYFFNLDAIREPLTRPEALGEGIVVGGVNKGRRAGVDATARRRGSSVYGAAKYADAAPFPEEPGAALRPTGRKHTAAHPRGKNPGDVWSLPTRPLKAAHFAAFPLDIPLRCIAASCPEDGVVLDPFSGAGTTGLAARQLGRSYTGIDLRDDFHDLALHRLGLDTPGTAGQRKERTA